jgi:hypothetical protein
MISENWNGRGFKQAQVVAPVQRTMNCEHGSKNVKIIIMYFEKYYNLINIIACGPVAE